MSTVSDAIKNEIQIIEYAQQCGYTLTRAGRQYSLKEHDSIRIDPERNVFYRHSTGTGGSIIDFAMLIHQVDTAKAISILRGELTIVPGQSTLPMHKPAPSKPTGPLEMPPKVEGRYKRAIAYLTKTRGIDRAIVLNMIERRQLYEDDRHNCVFIGFDQEDKTAFGCMRGTSTYRKKPFRRDLENSQKEIGFYVDNGASRLVVCEAPIDSMSFMTLLARNKVNWKKFDYLAISGMCLETLPYHMARLPQDRLSHVYLATDNDKRGNEMRVSYRNQLEGLEFKGKIIDKVPVQKDWNLDLLAAFPREVQQPKQQYQKTMQMERGIQP
ncbi:DUF3991 and TOPRIM domain-containing protein (plasmid) [Oscillospiraceae bacterium MB08-C2-2]|nr:DUF3991 and TOPRIM domain-containing protein [Oscillospiraceae bacterium MB08-C2-2]